MKCSYDHRLTNKAYLSTITVTNISQVFYLQNGGEKQLERKCVAVTLFIWSCRCRCVSSGAVPGVPRGDQHAGRSGQRLVGRVRCAQGRQRGRRRPQHGSRELQLHPVFRSQLAVVDGRSRHSPDRHRSSVYQPQQLRYEKNKRPQYCDVRPHGCRARTVRS